MIPEPDEAGLALRAAMDRLAGRDPSLTPIALGWATVDLDRAEHAFRDALAGFTVASEDMPDDILLGARCRLIRTDVPGVAILLLLEPFTEGRLAATLARHGEGPAVVWMREEPDRDLVAVAAAGSALVVQRSRPAQGPLGTEVLLRDAARAGPYRLLVVAEPGTITP
jgi:hypothetical protein